MKVELSEREAYILARFVGLCAHPFTLTLKTKLLSGISKTRQKVLAARYDKIVEIRIMDAGDWVKRRRGISSDR